MELEKNNVTTFEQEKSLTTQEQYEIDKKKKWEENKLDDIQNIYQKTSLTNILLGGFIFIGIYRRKITYSNNFNG